MSAVPGDSHDALLSPLTPGSRCGRRAKRRRVGSGGDGDDRCLAPSGDESVQLEKEWLSGQSLLSFFPSFAGFLLTEMSDTAGLRSRSITAGGTLHQHDQLEGGSTGVRRSPTESDTAQDVS